MLNIYLSSDDHIIGRGRKAIGLVSLTFSINLKGTLKNPLTLFDKSWDVVPSVMVWPQVYVICVFVLGEVI